MMRRRILTFCWLLLLLAHFDVTLAQSITRATYGVINDVQELMDEERFDEAIEKLELLVEKTRDNPYDNAIANQYLAHNSVMLDDTARARRALQTAVALPGLPPEMLAELKVFYGSVLMNEEEFGLAAQMFEEWLAVDLYPTAQQLFSIGYAHYMNGNAERAEVLLARAIDKGADSAQESWYQVYYRALFDLKKYSQGEEVLYELITRNPARELGWRMLASHYLQLEQSSDALAAIMLSYLNDQVTSATDLKRIVSLYGFVDVPEKAARLLDQWLAEGKIETDADTRKQLGNLWLLARETEKAKVALRAAADASPDGKTFELLGGIYFEDEDWRDAHRAYQDALRLGGLEEPLRVSLLAGISAYSAGMSDEARSALRRAAESPKYRRQAEDLLKKIDDG